MNGMERPFTNLLTGGPVSCSAGVLGPSQYRLCLQNGQTDMEIDI